MGGFGGGLGVGAGLLLETVHLGYATFWAFSGQFCKALVCSLTGEAAPNQASEIG